jgi:copper resistance protein C
MRRVTRAVLAAVVAAGFVLAAATPASAHNYVVSTTPAEGDVLTALPAAWEVVTNENLLDVENSEVTGLWVSDADGLFYGDGCVDVSGPGMTAEPVIGAPGAYTLVYSFVSADGHPVSGEVPFEWSPSGEHEAATGTAEATRCGATPPPTEAEGDDAAQPGIPSEVWWIGGAVLAVVVAIALTVAFTRPRRATSPVREGSSGS